MCTLKDLYIKELYSSSSVLHEGTWALQLEFKCVNEIYPPFTWSKSGHIFYCLKWIEGILKIILSFMSWAQSQGNAVKLLNVWSSSTICIRKNKNLKIKEKIRSYCTALGTIFNMLW